MSCIRSPKKRKAEAKRVSTFEILAPFEDEHETLARLAFVITGDIGAAERSISKARELVTNGAHPFGVNPLDGTNYLDTVSAFIKGFLHVLAGEGVWGRGRHLSPFPQ